MKDFFSSEKEFLKYTHRASSTERKCSKSTFNRRTLNPNTKCTDEFKIQKEGNNSFQLYRLFQDEYIQDNNFCLEDPNGSDVKAEICLEHKVAAKFG